MVSNAMMSKRLHVRMEVPTFGLSEIEKNLLKDTSMTACKGIMIHEESDKGKKLIFCEIHIVSDNIK